MQSRLFHYLKHHADNWASLTTRCSGCSARFSSLAGWWNDDLAPRRHITVESISEKAILHRMKFIIVLYSYESLMEMRLASLLNAIVADGPQPQMWKGQGECCL